MAVFISLKHSLLKVKYAQTGKSAQTNTMGMREMQEKAFQARDAQYLLLKAPPASGKSPFRGQALWVVGDDERLLALPLVTEPGRRQMHCKLPAEYIRDHFGLFPPGSNCVCQGEQGFVRGSAGLILE